MNILVVSSSLEPHSRSEVLARRCADWLSGKCGVQFVTLKDYPLDGRDLHDLGRSLHYSTLHRMVTASDGLVLASPVYNWSCCAELKRFVEIVGTTPPDGSVRGAFFDKLVTFVNAAGGLFSYPAFTGLANSMMLDFKCIINPYNIYADNRDWAEGTLSDRLQKRLAKSMDVLLELTTLLKARTYRSEWEL